MSKANGFYGHRRAYAHKIDEQSEWVLREPTGTYGSLKLMSKANGFYGHRRAYARKIEFQIYNKIKK